ncbi:MAG: DUF362 domain-containing protein [Desulfobacterales bacterium]|nr:DUF362 domain-containing protein [Desulfobacterales bacterium]MDJ0876470.1 DUF362 domain-containing protein [Desulfobacterales bacterium]MDJ0884367.1 DUF362 domain-containing protein [Desulfobacterales bacterium]
MASKVYFWNLRTSMKMPYAKRIKRLIKRSGVFAPIESKSLVALKVHFGEAGTTGHIAPIWIRPIVALLVKAGARPFLADTNTLYTGQRYEGVSHALVAARHGFDPNVLGAPVVIADGIRSQNAREVAIAGKHFETCSIAGDFVDADVLVTLNHFKGHLLGGFGGALKNLAMGCATVKGKMQQHCDMGPTIIAKNCTGCGSCVAACLHEALSLEEEKATLDEDACVGCGACMHACEYGAMQIEWKENTPLFLERMVEYAAAALASQEIKAHITFVTNVSPGCDCEGHSDAPICPDLGVLVSSDPVAVDQAALDLVNQAPPHHPSALPKGIKAGDDKFMAVYPDIDGTHALAYGESMGLGTRAYERVNC